ncbi:precorrin-2 dehydrogenase/sirohydrochlorin ferrochelatase family protein [Paenibacillus ginsengarvi]|uniref:precorrin-2 dehydrogenase n=1 Tax=Paenibacillus ginsengarvi TaxID=400777 RepID=A0A3B0CG46_9BACL|nr:bifunctional precorrin-2 dehydrogenase/sirohydrochlorin ferrochelatase [Paenibacillus ginsengarvi]RKN83868.1 bifunctional precorrin-2 dehydrogenase/sirohydrochlorin ferrochelatase [Paenibacillus ginsengarvi]
MSTYYPAMLKLTGSRCLVVGGGRVAERKIAGLLEAGADVVVVSPEVTEAIGAWEMSGRVTVLRKRYAGGEDEGASLVFACTDSRETNQQVHADATRLGKPVNVADRPDLCSFVVPAVWRRGPLLVAVSTSGTNPIASTRIRDRIEQAVGDHIDSFLGYAAEYRQRVIAQVHDAERRKRLLAELFSDEALDQVRAGRWEELKRRMEAVLDGGSQ